MTPTDLRQNEIFDKYYFVCQCPRCTDETETVKMIAAECPNPKCDNVLDLRGSTYMCPICEKEIAPEHQEMYSYLMEFTPSKLYEMLANDTACKFFFEVMFHEKINDHEFNFVLRSRYFTSNGKDAKRCVCCKQHLVSEDARGRI